MNTPSLPDRVTIVEVGPRDGLQNEPTPIPTARKVEFVEKLANAGLTRIEATSFVSPEAVPQLADADELYPKLPKGNRLRYQALVPNEKGLDRALDAGVSRIVVFTAASDSFCRHNIHMSVDESLDVFAGVLRRARDHGMTARGYISTSFVCPFEGDIPTAKVVEVGRRLLDLGVDEIAVSDTIGAAAPRDIFETAGALLDHIPAEKVALHLHDTYGTGLANVLAGLQLGITTFDASAGGLGGCPFAPAAAGNLATEDLVYFLDRMDIASGVKLDDVLDAIHVIADPLGRPLRSRQWQRIRGEERRPLVPEEE